MHMRPKRIATALIAAGAVLGALTPVLSPLGPAHAGAAAPMIWTGSHAVTPVKKVADQPQLTDGIIAYLYIQANLFEVETAELGKARGTSPDVKQHGAMVAKDHRGVVKSFEELLHRNHIKPAETAGSQAALSQHEAVMADLKTRSGADFDAAYLAFEAKNHRAVIVALRDTLLPATKNAEMVQHFKDMLPTFEHHLAVTDAAVATAAGSSAE